MTGVGAKLPTGELIYRKKWASIFLNSESERPRFVSLYRDEVAAEFPLNLRLVP